MSDMATSDDGSNLCGAADQLASDGFVLLHQLCNSELVELVLDVSRRRAHAVREALGAKEIGIGSAAGYVSSNNSLSTAGNSDARASGQPDAPSRKTGLNRFSELTHLFRATAISQVENAPRSGSYEPRFT